MTSNLGTEVIREYQNLGFSKETAAEGKFRNVEEKITKILRENFRPEFLNRLDEIIIFNALSKDELKRIVAIQLERVKERLARQNIQLKMTPKTNEYLAARGFDPVYGARPLKRVIQRLILDPLALELLKRPRQSKNMLVFSVDIVNETVRIKEVKKTPEKVKV